MSQVANKLSLQEFLDLPESGDRYEIVDGELVPKMSPTTPHSRVQKRLLRLIDDWCNETASGEVNPEWAVALKRRQVDWIAVPDLTYISFDRVPSDWDGEGVCPERDSRISGRNYFSRPNIWADDTESYRLLISWS